MLEHQVRSRRLIVRALPLFAFLAVSLSAAPAVAQFKCVSKIDKKTGAVLISAAGFNGTLRWSPTETGVARDFANQSECSDASTAKGCLLDLVQPEVPPADCVVRLTDGTSDCSTRVRGCTPGQRGWMTLDGIAFVKAGTTEFGAFVKRGLFLRNDPGVRDYGTALRRRATINGLSSTNPAIRSGITAMDDWEAPVAFALREMAVTLRATVQADPSLAPTAQALWPVGEFWWSRTENPSLAQNQWGVRRVGPAQFSLRTRLRSRTGHLALVRGLRSLNLRRTSLTRELDQPSCCQVSAGACLVWGPPCP